MRRALTLLACALMSGWAGAGGGGVHGDTPTVTGRQIVLRPDAPAVAPLQGGARSIYVLHCAGCHGMDASGSALGRVPDMRRVGDFLQLPGGREFIVKVPGVMGSGLDDAQVAAVTNWVLATLAAPSQPPGHRAYTADEIQQARASPLLDVAAERQRLVSEARRRGVALATAP
ncbi:c-type cytochrome [Ideonella paludis]|uniref:Cytochrome C n=1 Tax=Ideonella paludis TaxID=1233411 RepID=A0ABS5DSK1_9BURK|nr:cytochrome c [Ideonella paludis]MBQ0934111.1 cytochrome C [Ideonella paludis]